MTSNLVLKKNFVRGCVPSFSGAPITWNSTSLTFMDEMINKLNIYVPNEISSICDLTCGSGYLTMLLATKYRTKHLVLNDKEKHVVDILSMLVHDSSSIYSAAERYEADLANGVITKDLFNKLKPYANSEKADPYSFFVLTNHSVGNIYRRGTVGVNSTFRNIGKKTLVKNLRLYKTLFDLVGKNNISFNSLDISKGITFNNSMLYIYHPPRIDMSLSAANKYSDASRMSTAMATTLAEKTLNFCIANKAMMLAYVDARDSAFFRLLTHYKKNGKLNYVEVMDTSTVKRTVNIHVDANVGLATVYKFLLIWA